MMQEMTKSAKAPWFTSGYCQIERCRFDESSGILSVTFGDGQTVQLNPTAMVPDALVDVDWRRAASNEEEIVVPYAEGWYEIPWDVVRTLTDPAFDAHMRRRESPVALDPTQPAADQASRRAG